MAALKKIESASLKAAIFNTVSAESSGSKSIYSTAL
jgi:hypothetical protein